MIRLSLNSGRLPPKKVFTRTLPVDSDSDSSSEDAPINSYLQGKTINNTSRAIQILNDLSSSDEDDAGSDSSDSTGSIGFGQMSRLLVKFDKRKKKKTRETIVSKYISSKPTAKNKERKNHHRVTSIKRKDAVLRKG
eukprot:UN31154